VNDNFGHHAGDAALIRISAHLQSAFTDAELICRLGGDEFLVLTFADQRTLRMQIRTFRRTVASDPEHARYKNLFFGVSCGTARVTAGISIQRALQQADERMYAFKTRCKQLAARYLVA
jgi:diguanylate cyclase (GGDEF)-like protein